ncbi:M48 family metallopeptidase [Sulfuricella sp. T08]|uniref:tetratricopeptide repeat protein n=1 Tax=Sulfuricella sp. T08 TaxID=1632857 RepID=UPI0007507635|nr:tetratricopeptide repeat protein [Sulfuricella sp. T08]
MFDDTINIIENAYLKINTLDTASLKAAAFSMGNGISGRPLSMASFALDYYFNGSEPYGFKLTNLVIHLLNGVCIFVLTTLVLEIHRRRHAPEFSPDRVRWVSLAVASAWLLHPLNLTSVLYVVQRMASLSALFTLLGLITYLYGRRRQLDGHAGWGWILAGFFLFTPLAVLSKENGALLPAFMLLTEVALLNFQAPAMRTRLMLTALLATTVVLPAIVLAVYSIYKPAWLLVGYSIRDFTLPERLMTEARVLWFYLRLIIVPDISQLGLQHDDIAISRGLLAPYSTLFASIGIALLAGVAVLLRKRHPIAAFGILFFLLGHSIESSVIALEIAHEHRNYLPIYGILLVVFYYLLSPTWYKDTLRLRQLLALILVLIFGAVTSIRAEQWADPNGLKLMEVTHHPDSLRANADVAYIYAFLPAFSPEQAEEYYRFALSYYQKAADLSPTDTSGLLGLIGLNAMRGKPIEERWVRELEYRLEHRPFAPAAANSLMHLEKCLTKGICRHSPQDMARLLQAALRNPTLYGNGRSSMQFAWSNLLFLTFHDRDAALKAAHKAMEADPADPDTRITFIKFLLNLGKPDDAKKQIVQLRQLDDMKIYGDQLDELEKLATMLNQTAP